MQRANNAKRQMQSSAGIADLRAGHHWRAVIETRCRCGAARALSNVLIDFAVLIRAGTEALDGCQDHPRIELLNPLPRETHAVECAGGEIFHHDVTFANQRFQHFLPIRVTSVDGDRAFVVVQHREIKAVDAFDILQLATGDVARARPFHLDHVGAEPREKLRAGWAGLHMGEVKYSNSVECFAHCTLPGRAEFPLGLNDVFNPAGRTLVRSGRCESCNENTKHARVSGVVHIRVDGGEDRDEIRCFIFWSGRFWGSDCRYCRFRCPPPGR